MKNNIKDIFLVLILLVFSSVCFGADKQVQSNNGDLILKSPTSGKKVNVNDTLYTTQSGYVGIKNSTPTKELEVTGTIKTTVGLELPQGNTLSSTYPTVNMAQNPINFKQACATGYILVPKDNIFTFQDFCVMKYEAKGSAGSVTSTPTGSPYVSITQYDAKNQCATGQAAVKGAHLITPAEWMTIARNIEATAINDIDSAAGIQLATGHSDNAPSNSLATTAGAEPSLSSCTLTLALSDASNASCALRGVGSSYAGNDTDKGYYGTSNYFNQAYTSGGNNKSQLRTHVLSNGLVIWDFSGNVWEWVDMLCTQTNWYTTGWVEWTNGNVTDWEKSVGGPSNSLSSTNGVGLYYGCSAEGNALLRGGTWNNGSNGGVFAVNLNDAPSNTAASIGFRCSYVP